MSRLEVEFPAKIAEAFEQQSRYLVLYGGRGSAKSWSVARKCIIDVVANPNTRILCAREIQKSIKDSVHQLLTDQISSMGLGSYFDILATEIRAKKGTGGFTFTGLRHNATEIKSHEGADRWWVEEANRVSPSSWKVLIPTIRKPESTIWVTYNPDMEDDETHQRFVVRPPANSTVVKVNWSDNPWFPDVLHEEMEELRSRSYDEYLNVWEGHCREILDGAIYAEELRKAKEDERITSVPVDHSKPVDVFFDLGWADCTSMWFVQTVGKEIRVIDFYQNQLQKIQHYVQILQNKGYIYNKMKLPHDAFNNQLSGKNTDQTLRDLGYKTDRVEKLSIRDGIQAARTLFPSLWIDGGRCADGIHSLKNYRYDVDPDTGKFSKEPLHNEFSHAADAFRYLAVGYKPPTKKPKSRSERTSGWMNL